MGLKEKLSKIDIFQEWNFFLSSPFSYVDNFNLKIRIRKKLWDFNIMKESQKMRYIIIRMAFLLTLVWFAMGFDSGVGQVNYPLLKFITGEARTIQDLTYWYNWAYGKYMHWSVFTIYGSAFWIVSTYLSGKDVWIGKKRIWKGNHFCIEGSQNFAYSFSIVLLSIGIFEWFWMGSFYVFQNQHWILNFQFPQAKLLLQNTGLTLVGLLCLFHIFAETKYKPRLDRKVLALSLIAIGSCLFWIYYPFNVTPLSVETSAGTWINSNNFPQTVYTIDIDPYDDLNAGEQFFIEDNLVHLVNTIAKIWVTLSIISIGLIVKKEKESYEV